MEKSTCPVADHVRELAAVLEEERITVARCRQWAVDILRLMKDVASGRGGPEHFPAMTDLAEKLAGECEDPMSADLGNRVLSGLREHKEVFLSHLETLNCPLGDCIELSPAPCQMACPAGIDVPGYVTLIGQGRDGDAVELIRQDNPFPWVCGLVCTHPCEFMCARGRMDKPVAIKDLKGFAAERAMSAGSYRNPERAPDNGRKVCIIGAGPAGLTAAYYLALKGYRVTVIEALPMAGGMMMVGIPRYRLPREVIDREVAMIEDLGVEFRYNTRLGKDTTIDALRGEGFEAFFIAVGAQSSYKMGIPGEDDFPQVIDAIDLLRRVALGERHSPGKRVAVIGGGNVAMDAARTCIRLGCEEVTVVYRRSRADMPANPEELEQAEEEDVRFSFLTVPVRIGGGDGKVTTLHCLRTELGPEDASGRRRPIPVEGSDFSMQVDAVIPAIGQTVDKTGLDSLSDLNWSRRNTIRVDRASLETSVHGIFAAGDVVLGPATVVEAIGGGKRAAEAIDRFFEGIPQPKMPSVPVRRQRLGFLELSASTKMTLARAEMQMLGYDRRRITFQQVELGLSENSARAEAKRCLRCDICVRCGTCVDICRDKMGVDALHLGYLNFDRPGPTDLRVAAERCILCGACAANCSTGAMRMEDIGGERVLSLCGTVLNRLELEHCMECGTALGPARYHDFIRKRTEGVGTDTGEKILCMACARKAAAKAHGEIMPPVA
ncbi:MAG: FAD-dependent oxidoreductase [Deltaproteobacteria bacterium]|nr:FAD-dependent oxidoreductase [Deltaproteobacteria bacterium]MBW2009019.1 FAD-dependent oxidoreductase [Deltaproteobacteria bacterium]